MTDIRTMTPGEWLVVFEPTTSLWWGRFLAPRFGHCWMLGHVGGAWVFMEPLIVGTMIGVLPDAAAGQVFVKARTGDVRMLAMRPVGHEAVRPRFVVTCAGAIGSVLGLRRLPLTPRGLFWTLRRLGAREIGRG